MAEVLRDADLDYFTTKIEQSQNFVKALKRSAEEKMIPHEWIQDVTSHIEDLLDALAYCKTKLQTSKTASSKSNSFAATVVPTFTQQPPFTTLPVKNETPTMSTFSAASQLHEPPPTTVSTFSAERQQPTSTFNAGENIKFQLPSPPITTTTLTPFPSRSSNISPSSSPLSAARELENQCSILIMELPESSAYGHEEKQNDDVADINMFLNSLGVAVTVQKCYRFSPKSLQGRPPFLKVVFSNEEEKKAVFSNAIVNLSNIRLLNDRFNRIIIRDCAKSGQSSTSIVYFLYYLFYNLVL